MYSSEIKLTQQRLAQLIDDTLYPKGSSYSEIATLVRNNPNVCHYTLSDIEEQIGKKGFAALVTVLRLSMPPYNVFETTFEWVDDQQKSHILTLNEYQHSVLCGGFTTPTGQYIDIETINREAIIHLQVRH